MKTLRMVLNGLLVLCLSLSAMSGMAANKADSPTITASPSQSIQGLVNINTADAKGLKKVKGIGTSRAKAIIEYREKNGDFKTVSDLGKIQGFSPRLMSKIHTQLTVG